MVPPEQNQWSFEITPTAPPEVLKGALTTILIREGQLYRPNFSQYISLQGRPLAE